MYKKCIVYYQNVLFYFQCFAAYTDNVRSRNMLGQFINSRYRPPPSPSSPQIKYGGEGGGLKTKRQQPVMLQSYHVVTMLRLMKDAGDNQ